MAENGENKKVGKAVVKRVFAEVERKAAMLDRGLSEEDLREFGVQDEIVTLAVALRNEREAG